MWLSWDNALAVGTGQRALSRLLQDLVSLYDFYHPVLNAGLVRAAGSDTVILQDTASTRYDAHVNVNIKIVNGSGHGQTRTIVHYDGITRTALLDAPWGIIPDNTSAYVVKMK